MIKTKEFILSFIFFCSLSSSSGAVDTNTNEWSSEERKSMCNYIRSREITNHTINLIDTIGDLKKIPPEIIVKSINGYSNALTEANKVSKSMLQKIHPSLPEKYKSEYIASLQIRIKSWDKGSFTEISQAHYLYSSFVNWHSSHKNAFKIPKGVISDCRK